jgi:multiple sugar transport system substrate-binding protein
MDMPRRLDRRRFVGLAGLSALGAYLVACGAPPAPTSPAPTKSAASAPAPTQAAAPAAAAPGKARDKIELRLWHWDSFLTEPYEKVGAEFSKKFAYASVAVENTPAGEYPQKVTASVAGGAPPDLIGITVTRADFLTFASKGQLIPVINYIKRDNFDLGDFYDINLKQHTWKGTLYNLPYAWNTMTWYYQEEIFQKAGEPSPGALWKEGKWNWDAYKRLAARFTTGSGLDKYFGSGTFRPDQPPIFLPLAWSHGADIYDPQVSKSTLTESATMEAMQFVYDLKKFMPGPEDTKTGTQESGRLAMWPNWDVHYVLMRANTNFKYGIVPPPASPKSGKHFFIGNAPGFGIPKGSKNADDSWELLKFVLSPEMLVIPFLEGNNAPPRKSQSTNPDLWKKQTKFFDPDAMFQIAKAKEQFARNPAKISNFAQINTAFTEEMTLVWADKQSLADGVKKVTERVDKLLKEAEVDPDNGGMGA